VSRVLCDTSPLIASHGPRRAGGCVSSASLAELHFGTLVAADRDERAQRLAVIEATFDPLPVDAPVAREWGRLAAAVAERGGRPHRRAIDLAIAATAHLHGVPLLTTDTADFAIIDDLVEVQALD